MNYAFFRSSLEAKGDLTYCKFLSFLYGLKGPDNYIGNKLFDSLSGHITLALMPSHISLCFDV